ncbi:MAG: DeoR/GlpR family DNA-binding transcription regulator [Pseudomonadota bacterium]
MAKDRDQRRRRILAEFEQHPSLRVSQLAARLGVSAETVRRDLDALTTEGQVDRTYGGAMRRRSLEPSVSERHNMRAAERERIARRGCPLLKGAGLVMIGSGATTVHLARRIALEMNDLTVIAHSFGVATVLALNPTITVLMVPGAYHAGEGAIHGAEAVGFLDGYQADWAVLGASGMDAGGPSDALLEAGEVYRRMVARAERTMLVADSSKFGKRFPACWAGWSDISCVVTDAAPPDGLVPADSPTHVLVA